MTKSTDSAGSPPMVSTQSPRTMRSGTSSIIRVVGIWQATSALASSRGANSWPTGRRPDRIAAGALRPRPFGRLCGVPRWEVGAPRRPVADPCLSSRPVRRRRAPDDLVYDQQPLVREDVEEDAPATHPSPERRRVVREPHDVPGERGGDHRVNGFSQPLAFGATDAIERLERGSCD